MVRKNLLLETQLEIYCRVLRRLYLLLYNFFGGKKKTKVRKCYEMFVEAIRSNKIQLLRQAFYPTFHENV